MRFFLILILAGLVSCQTDQSNLAPTQDYFFEITDLAQNSVSKEDIYQITNWLPKYKYFISWQSGNTWPFFESYDLATPVIKDSLMTPHTHVHRIRPLTQFDPTAANKPVLVKIDYSIDDLSQPIIALKLFEWKNGDWTKLVDTGKHTILQKHFTNTHERQFYTFQTIVRYSFK